MKGFSNCCGKFAFWGMVNSSTNKVYEHPQPQFLEVDPTGRYGRYDEILGMGASKTVYKGFDEYEGIEVAWNQVKLNSFLRSPENLERLYCEIHLLKTLNHKNIMKFFTSWVDTSKRKINFVSELFTSGTLRQYRQRHRKVNIRALKNWCRQILSGLVYLHSHDPPIIHRDLKCDNIFINGNQGEVKIGDLGLAAILRKPLADHCVGTPEFMAPEVYEEAYNELVDVYSFGMCILEMVTLDYPYSECTRPVEIYKKVTSGRKPNAFYEVKNPEVRKFVEKCIAKVSERWSAKELLDDPFLQFDEPDRTYWEGNVVSMNRFDAPHNPWIDSPANLDIMIEGMRRDDGSIFLNLRISDREGNVRNIFFPFNIESDTPIDVATEMVTELNMMDYDVAQIAELIDDKVSSLESEWRPGLAIGEIPDYVMQSKEEPDVLTANSVLSYLITNEGGVENLNSPSENMDCALHGRFGEITYHIKDSESGAQGALILSPSQNNVFFQTNSNEEFGSMDQSGKIYDHRELCFENLQIETDDQNETTSLSSSVYMSMKSFHLGRNFSYRIPSDDGVHNDGNIIKKSIVNVNMPPEHYTEERKL